jgi:hypothetical protein
MPVLSLNRYNSHCLLTGHRGSLINAPGMPAQPPIWSRVISLCLAGLLILTTSGCLTRHLWNDSTFRDDWEPAGNPRLQLYQSPPPHEDVLVRYDETQESSDQVRSRAYFLHENQSAIQDRRKPLFLPPDSIPSGEPIPVYADPPAPPQTRGFYAVSAAHDSWFVLYKDGTELGIYELPAYATGASRAKRVALTPVAVVGDVVIVAVTVGGILFLIWAEGGGGGI